MRYLVSLIVLVISAGSVVFGVEWMSAPMTPMPASSYALRAAKAPATPAVQQAAAPAAKPAAAVSNNVSPPAPAAQPAPATVAAAPAVAASTPEPAPLIVPEPQPSLAAAPPPLPLCDIQACERAYRTFTASDCTYQPSGDGPRRLCTRGNPPAASSPRSDIRAQATCNVAACSDAYISFNAADCTYQPSGGPRRICER